VTYTVTVANDNTSPSSATGVTMAFNLDNQLIYQSASGAGWSCGAAGSVVTCNTTGPIAAGATTTIDIVVTAPAIGGTMTNNASITAIDQNDTDVTDNSTGNQGTTVNAGGGGGGGGGSMGVISMLLMLVSLVMRWYSAGVSPEQSLRNEKKELCCYEINVWCIPTSCK
jgi:hypothetical protein